MKNNKLIAYKENIFTKILNFLKKILFKEKLQFVEINEETKFENQYKDSFSDRITIKENEEEKRLRNLQIQYENGEIDEEDISNEDMDKLIEMYEKETEELNRETENTKIHISQMLKELNNL